MLFYGLGIRIQKMEKYIHKVQYYETDRMGITHHSNYIRWMEEARVDFLMQLGWGYDKLEDEGVLSPVTAIACHYKKSTTFSDVISIDVSVEEFRGIKLKLKYRMTKGDGEVVCEGLSEHCFLDKDGKLLRLDKSYPEFDQVLKMLGS